MRKVSQGILIAFDDVLPSLLRYPLELPSNNKTADLLQAVQKLRLSRAIEEVMDTTSPGYYSRLFLVPKPDGSFRPIIDLKKLNQFIVVPSFKMETLFSIIAALQPQEWITKIDLKDAYHHIMVHVNIRKYFRFVVAVISTSYQLVGIRSNSTCTTSMGSSVETLDCESLLRQQYSSSIHPQTRGNTFSTPILQNSGTVRAPGSVCNNSHTYTPPRSQDITADALSRLSQPSPTEWRLPTETLNNLFCAFGTPLIDMFATAENKVTPVFVSPYPDDRAWAVDALSLSWDDLGLVYAFPPAPIVPKTLQKIQKSRGNMVIIIASQHPSRPWHPLLLQLSTRPRISLHDVQLFQYVPNLRRPQYHRDPRLLDLAAWNLSGTS